MNIYMITFLFLSGLFYFCLGNKSETQLIVDKKEELIIENYTNLTDIYLAINNSDSAFILLDTLSKHIDDMDNYELYNYYDYLHRVCVEKKDYLMALTYYEKAMDAYTQIMDDVNKESIQEIKAQHNNEKLYGMYNQMVIKMQWTEFCLAGIALIVIVIAVSMFVLYRVNKNKKRMVEEETGAMECFSGCEKGASDHIHPDVNRVNKLLQNKLIEELDLMKKVAYIHSISMDEKKKSKEYAKLIDEKTENILKWDNLYKLIDELYPGFRTRLDEKKPHLSEKEKQMCCLVKTRFRMAEIAYILGYNSESAVSMKYKLRKKAGFSSMAEFDEFLNGL